MRAYVARARQCEPFIPEALTEHIVAQYVELRQELDAGNRRTFVTARSLLAVLRLSQAVARIHLADEVTKEHVAEAHRLVFVAKQMGGDDDDGKKPKDDPNSAIFSMMKKAKATSGSDTMQRSDVLSKALLMGFSEADVDACIEEYQNISVLDVSYNGSTIRIL
jgi:DNA replication licensing factor MCM7